MNSASATPFSKAVPCSHTLGLTTHLTRVRRGFLNEKAPAAGATGAFYEVIPESCYSFILVTLNSVRRLRWYSSSVVGFSTMGRVSP